LDYLDGKDDAIPMDELICLSITSLRLLGPLIEEPFSKLRWLSVSHAKIRLFSVFSWRFSQH